MERNKMDDAQERLLSEPLITGDGEGQNCSLLPPDQWGSGAESSCGLSSDIEVIDVQQQSNVYDDDEIDEVRQLFGSPYAKSCSFWRKSFACIVLGFMVGCAAAAFFALLLALQIRPLHNNINSIASTDENGYFESKEKLGRGKGDWRWIIVAIFGSILAGLILAIRPQSRFQKYLFIEIRDLDPEMNVVPFKLLSCFIALLSGASIGPEAFLETIGSAMGCVVAICLRFSSLEQKSMVLSGIGASLGVLFPSPYLGVLCAVELSIVSGGQIFNLQNLCNLGSDLMTSGTSNSLQISPRQEYHTVMEQISLMMITSTVSFLTLSLLRKPHSSITSSIGSEFLFVEEEKTDIFVQTAQAAVLGCLCGLIGCLYLIIQGTLKTTSHSLFQRFLHPFDVKRYWLATLIFPLVTGITYGLIAVFYPLTLGSGYEFIRLLFTLWKKNPNAKVLVNDDEIIAADLLFVSALLKLLSTVTCLGLGMFGGQIIPLIVAGVYLGFSLAFFFPFLSVKLTIACCSISIAGSFVPIPFTMVATVAALFGESASTTVPVVVSVVCAYTANAGLGTAVEIAKRKPFNFSRVDTEEQSAEIH